MTPEQMLEQLNRQGGDASADYNDSEDVEGYFGWKVEDGVITVHHVAADNLSHTDTHAWRLVPVEGDLFRDARLVLLPAALSDGEAIEYIRSSLARSLTADTDSMWERDTIAFLLHYIDQLGAQVAEVASEKTQIDQAEGGA